MNRKRLPLLPGPLEDDLLSAFAGARARIGVVAALLFIVSLLSLDCAEYRILALYARLGSRPMPASIAEMKGDELRDYLQKLEPGSSDHARAMSEIARRQLFETFRATEAQVKAAAAEERAALASEKNASYMLASVVVAFLAAVASAASAYFAYQSAALQTSNSAAQQTSPPAPAGGRQ